LVNGLNHIRFVFLFKGKGKLQFFTGCQYKLINAVFLKSKNTKVSFI